MRQINYRPLDTLQPHPENAKTHDIGVIIESIKRFGSVDPIVIDGRTDLIMSGHGRSEALAWLKKDGDTPPDGIRVDDNGDWLIPVVDGWSSRTDYDAHAAMIALNRTTELGGWDQTALVALLEQLAEYDDLDGVGYDNDDLDSLRQQLAMLDEPDDPWSDRVSKPRPDADIVKDGNIYKIGPHIIACGDSRDPELWSTIMGDTEVSLFFTDPPYGIDYSGGGGVQRDSLDGDTPDEAIDLFSDMLDAVTPVHTPGASIYVTLPSGPMLPRFLACLNDRELYRWGLVWVKNNATFGRADYHPQHEFIAYGWWPDGPHHKVENRSETTVWNIDRPTTSDNHPTEKPLELIERAIENSSQKGTIVADPFGGSMTTIKAAHNTGRYGVAVEYYAGYVEQAIPQLEELTGSRAERLN